LKVNRIRKIISMMLAGMTLLTTVSIPVHAEEQVLNESENLVKEIDERFLTASAIFTQLKVFPEAPEAEATLNREEFARLMTKALKLPVNDSVRDGVFADVPGKYKEAPYIAAAADAGVFVGKAGNMFRPRDLLTEDEAVIALVNATGYRELVKISGDNLANYLRQAREIGITDGVSVVTGQSITYEKLLILMYQAFCADMFLIKEFDGKSPVYQVVEDVTLFSELYELMEDEGIVIADRYTYLDEPRFGKEDTIIIDNGVSQEEYDTTLVSGETLLGHRVKYSFFEDEEAGVLKLVSIKSHEKNQCYTVMSEQILEYENGILSCETDGKRAKNIKVPDSISVIYNGMAFAYADNATFCPEYGKLTFINNDNDGEYDVVIIDEYQSITLWAVDTENYILYPDMSKKGFDALLYADGTPVPDMISLGDPDYFRIEKAGKKISLARLKKGDVITVMQSDARSGSVITKLLVSDKKVSGTVTGMEYRDGEKQEDKSGIDILMVDGVDYPVAGDVMLHTRNGFLGTFLLDFDGRIVGWTSDSEMKTLYAYLINAGYDTDNNEIFLRMLYENGVYLEERVSQKVKLDEETYRFSNKQTAEVVLDHLIAASGETGVGNGGFAQPIKVSFKGNGEISKLDTMLDSYGRQDNDRDGEGLIKYAGEPGKALKFRSATGIFDGQFAVDANTIVFDVLKNPAEKIYNIDKFQVKKGAIFDNDSAYNVVAYDASAAGVASVVVSYYTNLSLMQYGGILLVDSIAPAWNETTQESSMRITGYYHDGSKKSIDVRMDANGEARTEDNKILDNKITRGDVIRANVTKNGYLYNSLVIYDNEAGATYTDKLPGSSSAGNYTDITKLIHGYVENVDGNFFTVNSGEKTLVYHLTGAKIYVFDGDEVKAGSSASLISNQNRSTVRDKVVLYTSSGRVRTVYVYKGGVE